MISNRLLIRFYSERGKQAYIPHPQLNNPTPWWENLATVFARVFVGVGVSRDLARELAIRVRPRHLDPAGWLIFDDTKATLQTCTDRGWRQYILSNHVPELPELVAALGLGAFFDNVISSANVGYEKPHPDLRLFEAGRR